jgi:hypothetical protein
LLRPRHTLEDVWMAHQRLIRDATMFVLGLATFIHEVLTTGAERPTILLGALALMGVPAFLRKDEAGALAGKGGPGAPAATPAELAARVDPAAQGETPS